MPLRTSTTQATQAAQNPRPPEPPNPLTQKPREVPQWRQEMNEARKALLKAWVNARNLQAQTKTDDREDRTQARAAFAEADQEVNRLYAVVRDYYAQHAHGAPEPPWLLALIYEDLKTYAPELLTRNGPTRAYLVQAGYLKR